VYKPAVVSLVDSQWRHRKLLRWHFEHILG